MYHWPPNYTKGVMLQRLRVKDRTRSHFPRTVSQDRHQSRPEKLPTVVTVRYIGLAYGVRLASPARKVTACLLATACLADCARQAGPDLVYNPNFSDPSYAISNVISFFLTSMLGSSMILETLLAKSVNDRNWKSILSTLECPMISSIGSYGA